MKHLLLILAIICFFYSCKKEVEVESETNQDYFLTVQQLLNDSLSGDDYSHLDFSRMVLTKQNNDSAFFIRVPFINKNMATDFVLLQTDKKGKYKGGKILRILRYNIQSGSGDISNRFDGQIWSSSLNKEFTIKSSINNGFIMALHKSAANQKKDIVLPKEAPSGWLPEVVIISSYSSGGGGSSFSNWYSLQGLVSFGGGGGGGSSSGYYSSSEPSYSPHHGGTGGSGNNQQSKPVVYEEEAVLVDFEEDVFNPAIDIEKYLKCFSAVPDNGATCSIELFADIPVDKDPGQFFNWQTGSPGHVFLQLKKEKGSQSVVQNIGYYPDQGWKTMFTTAPVTGKFVDNGGHEYNASIKMNLTPEKFQNIIKYIRYLARFIKYDIDEYNCTDFALEVFNYERVRNPLEITKYNLPGAYASRGTDTPQGIYQKLVQMKRSPHSEASNITIPGKKSYAGKSSGPCK